MWTPSTLPSNQPALTGPTPRTVVGFSPLCRGGVRSLQVREYREHPAVVVGRRWQFELGEDVVDVLADRLLAEEQRRGDAGIRAALGDQPQDLALPRSQ